VRRGPQLYDYGAGRDPFGRNGPKPKKAEPVLGLTQEQRDKSARADAAIAKYKAEKAAKMAASVVGSPGGTGVQYSMPADSEVSDHSMVRKP
jgi:hypothetical protein